MKPKQRPTILQRRFKTASGRAFGSFVCSRTAFNSHACRQRAGRPPRGNPPLSSTVGSGQRRRHHSNSAPVCQDRLFPLLRVSARLVCLLCPAGPVREGAIGPKDSGLDCDRPGLLIGLRFRSSLHIAHASMGPWPGARRGDRAYLFSVNFDPPSLRDVRPRVWGLKTIAETSTIAFKAITERPRPFPYRSCCCANWSCRLGIS